MGCAGDVYCENCGGLCGVPQDEPTDEERSEVEERLEAERDAEARANVEWAGRMAVAFGLDGDCSCGVGGPGIHSAWCGWGRV